VAGGLRETSRRSLAGNVKASQASAGAVSASGARLGVTRALVIEDSAAGIRAGRAAGFEVIAVEASREVAKSRKKTGSRDGAPRSSSKCICILFLR